MPKVYLDSIRQSEPCSDGARLTVIGEVSTFAFEGTGKECASYLQSLPFGMSVAVRHSQGLRSCMNKPALWEACTGYL